MLPLRNKNPRQSRIFSRERNAMVTCSIPGGLFIDILFFLPLTTVVQYNAHTHALDTISLHFYEAPATLAQDPKRSLPPIVKVCSTAYDCCTAQPRICISCCSVFFSVFHLPVCACLSLCSVCRCAFFLSLSLARSTDAHTHTRTHSLFLAILSLPVFFFVAALNSLLHCASLSLFSLSLPISCAIPPRLG